MTTSRKDLPAEEQGPWEKQVPPELNELLDEQVPGARNRNFRLVCRQAYVLAQTGEAVVIEYTGTQQASVVARIAEMCRGKTNG